MKKKMKKGLKKIIKRAARKKAKDKKTKKGAKKLKKKLKKEMKKASKAKKESSKSVTKRLLKKKKKAKKAKQHAKKVKKTAKKAVKKAVKKAKKKAKKEKRANMNANLMNKKHMKTKKKSPKAKKPVNKPTSASFLQEAAGHVAGKNTNKGSVYDHILQRGLAKSTQKKLKENHGVVLHVTKVEQRRLAFKDGDDALKGKADERKIKWDLIHDTKQDILKAAGAVKRPTELLEESEGTSYNVQKLASEIANKAYMWEQKKQDNLAEKQIEERLARKHSEDLRESRLDYEQSRVSERAKKHTAMEAERRRQKKQAANKDSWEIASKAFSSVQQRVSAKAKRD